jgi:hypothetical protein
MTWKTEVEYRKDFVSLLSSILECISRGDQVTVHSEDPLTENFNGQVALQLTEESVPYKYADSPPYEFIMEIRAALDALAVRGGDK